MNRMMFVAAMAAAVVATGCESEKPATDTNSPAASGAAPAEKLTDEQLDTVDIPVEEDFEDAAQTAINSDNLDDQLDVLEKEIGADKE